MNNYEDLEPLIQCDNCGKFIDPNTEGLTCNECNEEFYKE